MDPVAGATPVGTSACEATVVCPATTVMFDANASLYGMVLPSGFWFR